MVRHPLARTILVVAVAVMALGRRAFAQANEGARHVAAHDESRALARCAACHPVGDWRQTAPSERGGCDTQCAQCHAADTTGHHPTGVVIPPLREANLPRSSRGRIACRTCHDLTRPATDSLPWRAQSLFDAVFRRRSRYATYFLAMRNQRGQLCQSCH